MNQNLFNELRKFRNDVVHGVHSLDSADLAKRFSELGLSVPESDLPQFTSILLHVFSKDAGLYYVPKSILSLLSKLLDERSVEIICDPWAGIGSVLASVQETTQSTKAFALSQNDNEATLGRVLVPSAEWLVGDPRKLLSTLPDNFDVVASVLPFDTRRSKPIEVQAADGTSFLLNDVLGHQILAASSLKLSSNGIGIFVINQSFFSSQRSVLRQFDKLGLWITAAFALPPGVFAPYLNIPAYLAVIERRPTSRMFVAQLSTENNTNTQIIENFKKGQEGASLQMGCFVDVSTFTGIDALLTSERLKQMDSRFGYPTVSLGDLAISIKLGRPGSDFTFPKQENSIFVPLIGISDVLESMDGATLKHQNYAQVAVDIARSEARFVARFLNSELGREFREYNKSGIIPKLNTQSLKSIKVSIPDLQIQREILTIEALITAEENTLLSLQNEIEELRRMLWADPNFRFDVCKSLGILSSRFSVDLRQQTSESLYQWFESLPFPMASILRTWQATPSDDFKTKYEHLLDFFEASAEFIGIILLSAFSTREQLFEKIKTDLADTLNKQKLSFKRASFGTWKVVIEYLGKKVRELLSSDEKEQRATCSDMFADATMQVPEIISRKELAEIFSATNKMRNDWKGHGGVVGKETAQLRNEQLIAKVQNFRDETGDLWSNIKLVHSIRCLPRRSLFKNEVEILVGSNSEFLNETIEMPTWLDVDRLYLISKDGNHALRLLPLVLVGPSKLSAKNACHFFSRIENKELRFISYHFIDEPERMCPFEVAREAISLLED